MDVIQDVKKEEITLEYMDIVKEDVCFDDVKKEDDISLGDFPIICRICLKPGDLRPFHEEDYLLDLFLAITKIDVRSALEYPKSVCNKCINKLEEISLFIDISIYNNASLRKNTPKRGMENIRSVESGESTLDTSASLQEPQVFCRICLSSENLTLLERNAQLTQLFQNLTDVNSGANVILEHGDNICNTCIKKLEDISSFFHSFMTNDEKLANILGNGAMKIEKHSNLITLSTSSDLDHDINEGPLDAKLPYFTERICQKDSKINSRTRSEKPYPCDNCTKKFSRSSTLQKHLRNCTGEKLYHCSQCTKKYKSKWTLHLHFRTHTGEKPFECDQCEKRFARLSHLQEHLRTHTGEKPYKCVRCEVWFAQAAHLRVHLRFHSGEKPFKCDVCKRQFFLRSGLKSHSRVHTGEKPYECDECGKYFRYKTILHRHLPTHTGENSFKCVQCGKSFGYKYNLQRHLLTHTEEKLFECFHCQKRFKLKEKLQKHLRTHTDKKPFKCVHCDKRFALSNSLRVHIGKVHKTINI